MNEELNRRPSPLRLAFATFCMLLFWFLLRILPLYRESGDWGAALGGFRTQGGSWLEIVLPLILSLVLIWVIYPLFFGWIRSAGHGASRAAAWKRYRLVMSCGNLLGLAGLAWLFWQNRGAGGVPGDQAAFLGAVALFLLAILAYIWSIRLDDERAEAAGTGRVGRLRDERHLQVVGRSAAATLRFMLAAIPIGGAMHDILVTKVWPYRSALEVTLIFILWNCFYRRWDRRI